MGYMPHLNDTEKVLCQLSKGAFLTVKAGDIINTMTIGWGTIGLIWGRQIFTVLVRPTRFTFSLIEKTMDFTVSVPEAGMDKELSFCGSRSGKDTDKFKECNLKTKPSKHVLTPTLDLKGTHYECAIVYRTLIDPALLSPSFSYLYPDNDFHGIFYGEIRHSYSS